MCFTHYSPWITPLWQMFAPESRNVKKGGAMIREFVRQSLAQVDYSDFTLAARLLESDSFDTESGESECLDRIGAGIETTDDTLCWLMWELSQPQHHDKMTRLHNELVNASQEKGLETLPYLGAVVHEALRLWAPALFLFRATCLVEEPILTDTIFLETPSSGLHLTTCTVSIRAFSPAPTSSHPKDG